MRGKEAVVVIAVETLEKLLPPARSRQNLVAFLQGLGIGDLDLTRDRDTGRDIILGTAGCSTPTRCRRRTTYASNISRKAASVRLSVLASTAPSRRTSRSLSSVRS